LTSYGQLMLCGKPAFNVGWVIFHLVTFHRAPFYQMSCWLVWQ